MNYFSIDTVKTINASQALAESVARLKSLKSVLDRISLSGILDYSSRAELEKALGALRQRTLDESAKMDSLEKALRNIVRRYQQAEKMVSGNIVRSELSKEISSLRSQESGTDKRGFWTKLWDWITRREPDKYDTTSDAQQRAADNAMRKELQHILQKKKYSPEYWDKASVDERKQILQDYMESVIRVYGLEEVKTTIVWDDNATYQPGSITWGYYTDRTHTVTLNAKALTDSIGNWDSYDLLGTVAHELRHAYQHEAVRHPDKFMVSAETIEAWKKNFKNYISSGTDYDAYRNQVVEVDARSFEVDRNG